MNKPTDRVVLNWWPRACEGRPNTMIVDSHCATVTESRETGKDLVAKLNAEFPELDHWLEDA